MTNYTIEKTDDDGKVTIWTVDYICDGDYGVTELTGDLGNMTFYPSIGSALLHVVSGKPNQNKVYP